MYIVYDISREKDQFRAFHRHQNFIIRNSTLIFFIPLYSVAFIISFHSWRYPFSCEYSNGGDNTVQRKI